MTLATRRMIDPEGSVIYLGQIEAVPESATIDPNKWLALIDSHGALEHVPPRTGVNPFTGEPHEYKAPPSTASIRIKDADVGSIFWATDDSPYLTVYAEDDSAEIVATIAREVARAMGARFVQENVEE